MDEKKRIEELADFLWHNTLIHTEDLCHDVAETVIIEGYRKQSVGEWIWNPNGMDWGLGAWECSSCRCRNDNLPMDKNINPMRWAGAKFCPNCGAKMKGE